MRFNPDLRLLNEYIRDRANLISFPKAGSYVKIKKPFGSEYFSMQCDMKQLKVAGKLL